MHGFSIKTKITLATTFVLGIVFVCFCLVVYQRAKTAYLGRLDARLQGFAETFREEVEEQYSENRFPSIADFKDLKSEGMSGSWVRLSDQEGNVIYADSPLDAQASRPWGAIKPHEFTFENITYDGVRYRSLWTRIDAGDNDRYAVQIILPLTEVEANLRLLQLLFLIGVPLALIISAVAVYTVVVTSFRPLSVMIRTANSISASNLGERVPLPGNHDEVFVLAATLNTMIDRIEQAFRSQEQFVADASHEIRTPLAIIRSELEYARKQVTQIETRESLETALDEVDRLKKLSDELLLLAKLDTAALCLRKDIVRIDEVLAECVKKMKPIADSKGISLSLNVHSASEVEGDDDKLRSAIVNLLDNAVKYSNSGGIVEVYTRSVDGRIEISVCDHGEGIPEGEINDVFERFRRAASSHAHSEGSGLGLAIVRKVLEVHGGTVSVQSKQGEGATFTISLPDRNR